MSERRFNLFTSAGQRADKGLEDIAKGLGQIFSFSNENQSDEANNDREEDETLQVIRYFTARIGAGVEVEPVSQGFSYTDILKWAVANNVGNQIYLVKHYEKKSGTTLLCVFFANNGDLLLDDNSPKKCYVCKKLPESINDLFAGKNIFVQPFNK